jgi:glutathionyl-hydroquinone reductase
MVPPAGMTSSPSSGITPDGSVHAMSTDGTFVRDTRYLNARITADGREGWPVEPGRYRLAVARACPWANRAIIVRRLLGLESALSMALAGPTHDQRSWTFDLDPGGRDPVLGIERLAEAYEKAVPGYDRGVTVPAIVDIPTGAVVTNDYAQITLDLETEWTAYHRPGAPDLYPQDRRDEIDEVAAIIFKDVNNGVYQAGFARSQAAYEHAYRRLFDRLDQSATGSGISATWLGTRSPKPTSAFSPRWPASTPSTTGISNATGQN